ncbi:MAG: hypothetical protein K5931_09520 [Lachnospiraceae bacterium]|nr:hypothetical protein [Lachnospiraceae bacterium]
MNKGRLSVKEITYLGASLAMIEVSKLALDFLPNVELVTLLFIVFTIFYGKKTILIALGFTFIECLLKGFNIWSIMYLYIWPLLIIIVCIAHKCKVDYLFYCILSAFFGLFFGMFCSIPYLFIGGFKMALTWWVAGIPYDILHCVSNFIVCLILFNPLCRIMKKVMAGIL